MHDKMKKEKNAMDLYEKYSNNCKGRESMGTKYR